MTEQQPIVQEKKEEKEKKDIVEEAVAMSEEEFEAEVKEVNEDMKQWQREDEQEFLRRSGFHERKMEDKIQFIKKVEDAIIGRTYNEKFKNGKFWGIRNGKQMTDQELKKIEDIQRFYAFRRGEIQMPQPPAVRREVRVFDVKGGAFETKGRIYKVGNHEEPDSWLVQCWANQAGVSTEVIEATQTTEFAKAIVRAHMGGQFVDESVIHVFDIAKESIALEIIEKLEREGKKPIEGWDDEGRPILSGDAKRRIYERFLRFRVFAVRDAITKAARRAQLKIMNKEWREEEEIEAEASEVKMVQEEKR